MSTDLILLAVLMAAVTYPSRALPLLAPGIERLPPRALLYLRLVGPAVLASIAAVQTLVTPTSDTSWAIHVDETAVGVVVCLVLVAWKRNLLLGLVAGVVLVALLRVLPSAAGIG